MPVPGRNLDGLYFAVDYLKQQNKRNQGIDLHPEHETMLKDLNVELDEKGNVKTDEKYKTSVNTIFASEI